MEKLTNKSVRIAWIMEVLGAELIEAEKIYSCRVKRGYFWDGNYWFVAKDDEGNFYLYRNGWKEYRRNADGTTYGYRRKVS